MSDVKSKLTNAGVSVIDGKIKPSDVATAVKVLTANGDSEAEDLVEIEKILNDLVAKGLTLWRGFWYGDPGYDDDNTVNQAYLLCEASSMKKWSSWKPAIKSAYNIYDITVGDTGDNEFEDCEEGDDGKVNLGDPEQIEISEFIDILNEGGHSADVLETLKEIQAGKGEYWKI